MDGNKKPPGGDRRPGPGSDDVVVFQHYTPSQKETQPLATRAQRAYLVRLIKRVGRVKYIRAKRRLGIDGGPLSFTRSEASRLISALLEELQR